MFDARHTITIDHSMKDDPLEFQNVLYYELAHGVIYERQILHGRRQLDEAWKAAFAELVAFFAVLRRNHSNPLSGGAWADYREFKKLGGAAAALESYRRRRVFPADERSEVARCCRVSAESVPISDVSWPSQWSPGTAESGLSQSLPSQCWMSWL